MMRSIRSAYTIAGFVVLAGVLLAPSLVVAQAGPFGVQSADIQARLTPQGELEVEEVITYNLGSRDLTGITRRLRIPDDGGITVDSVRRDDLSEKFRFTRAGDVYRLTTGSSEIPLSGLHTYRLAYTIDGVVKSTENGSQIVWEAIAGSEVAAEDITIRLTAPFQLSQASCRVTETDRACPVDSIEGGVGARVSELPESRSLILQADLPSDTFAQENDKTNRESGQSYFGITLFVLFLLAGGSFGGYYVFADGSGNNEEPVPDHIDSLSS